MKRLPILTATLALGFLLATPAMAGHRGRPGGQVHHPVRGITLAIPPLPVPPLPHLPVPRIRFPRLAPSLSISVGLPVAMVPVYAAPAPVFYVPAPAMVAPPPARVWVPARTFYDGGVRFIVAGHWSYHRH